LSARVYKNFTVHSKDGNVTVKKDGNEYEIHRGHTIVSPVLFNSNLPHIYKDANVYDPDRFGLGREEDTVGGKFHTIWWWKV
jgi:sterol 14-demethylase